MLGLSQSVGYAVSALACLGESRCQMVFVRDIAMCANVPPAYLAKLFTKLAAAGLIDTKRGWSGGNQLARPPEEISLFEIAEAIEELPWLNKCLLGDAECSDERACPTHGFWVVTRKNIERELRSKTLADVIAFNTKNGLDGGKASDAAGTETTREIEESCNGIS